MDQRENDRNKKKERQTMECVMARFRLTMNNQPCSRLLCIQVKLIQWPCGMFRQTVQKRSFDQRGRDFKVGLKARRDKHCSLRSICRCIGRHCCACLSKNVRGAGSSLVERKHKRVHNRMTGLVDAVAGDPRTDRHLDTDIDVRVTSQSNFEIPTSASGRTVKSLEMHRIPACPEGV